ncbi:hypothetical protein J5U23_01396 [Saccharolobus shibatae B12]|uniref:Uncharacterized protein n=2 Tax=Saccharolobus shibatae TaxID=2286 RepID=A0A8F5BNH3_SACSH|nr:hypothetical protein J5U23_01396 [Saccharolobus shibatae B12]QXJ31947.1 hypothetical protein J5U21_01598 [Saccharolobus shibatae]
MERFPIPEAIKKKTVFLNLEDSKVIEKEVEKALVEFLHDGDVVFSPISFDSHPDHAKNR